jgi:hypothetical protein
MKIILNGEEDLKKLTKKQLIKIILNRTLENEVENMIESNRENQVIIEENILEENKTIQGEVNIEDIDEKIKEKMIEKDKIIEEKIEKEKIIEEKIEKEKIIKEKIEKERIIEKDSIKKEKKIMNEKKVKEQFNFSNFNIRHIALKISYIGTNYFGFASQDGQKTIEVSYF